MRDYGAVHTKFWQSADIRALSDDAKQLALYLLTCPHSNLIGCFRLPDGYVAADTGWSAGRICEGLFDLQRIGYATRFAPSDWVIIHKYMKWNPVVGPKSTAGAVKLYAAVPDVDGTRLAIFEAIGAFCPSIMGRVEPPTASTIEGVSKAHWYGFQRRVTDQDQDQDHKNPSQGEEYRGVGATAAGPILAVTGKPVGRTTR